MARYNVSEFRVDSWHPRCWTRASNTLETAMAWAEAYSRAWQCWVVIDDTLDAALPRLILEYRDGVRVADNR